MSEKKNRALRKGTKLLWPRQGERILSCEHAFDTNNAEVFAFVKPPRFRRAIDDPGSEERARFYMLCRPCVGWRRAGISLEGLLKHVGRWKNPDPIRIPLAELPKQGG